MFTKQYWNDRASKYGHTGHSEPFYYCFDQQARMFAISEVISTLPFQQKENALDFGCGSGDFIEVLLKDFKKVSGYDLSESVLDTAHKRYKNNPSVFLSGHFNEVAGRQPYDLVLSVTVLQNLTKAELEQTLQSLADTLSKGGYLISLDTYATRALNKEHNTDKATVEEWQKAFGNYGLTLKEEICFYNPVLFPSRSWQLYRHDTFLKLLKPFKNFKVVQSIFSRKAMEIIYREKDILHDQNSIFKIYILQK